MVDSSFPHESDPTLDDTPYRKLGWVVVIITFVFLLGWAAIAPLNSAVVADGRILVASLNKRVQHLDGGLVARIAVEDGDIVSEGQLLLSLDRKPLDIQLSKVSSQLIETEANLERLAVERDGDAELKFSSKLIAQVKERKQPAILVTQKRLFKTRHQALISEQMVLRKRQEKTKGEIASNKRMIKTLRLRLSLIDKDLDGLKKLAAKKMVSDSKLREVQRLRTEISGEVISHQADISRLESSLLEIKSQITLLERDFQKEVVTSQRELEERRIELQSQQSTIKEKLSRIDIRAPVGGKIKGFNVVTTGAVIKAGEPVMEIVPNESLFTIHARISPMDIDALYPGLKAEVRIPVFDGAKYFPTLYSELKDVSADVYIEERSDSAYYKATLTIDDATMDALRSENLQLISGMPVEVVIKTGERTLFDYLAKPLKDMVVRAFNEA
jgi:HlyD family type I secretion membrane fusion protein